MHLPQLHLHHSNITCRPALKHMQGVLGLLVLGAEGQVLKSTLDVSCRARICMVLFALGAVP